MKELTRRPGWLEEPGAAGAAAGPQPQAGTLSGNGELTGIKRIAYRLMRCSRRCLEDGGRSRRNGPGDRPCAPGAAGQVPPVSLLDPLPRSRPDPWRALFKYAQACARAGPAAGSPTRLRSAQCSGRRQPTTELQMVRVGAGRGALAGRVPLGPACRPSALCVLMCRRSASSPPGS